MHRNQYLAAGRRHEVTRAMPNARVLHLMNNLPSTALYNLVFVVGPHKSGTSLLTKFLSKEFFDPSRVTNFSERGYGQSVERYLTRECEIVRWINHRTMEAQNANNRTGTALNEADILNAIEWYLGQWPRPLVIKSPYFAYTLHLWLRCASRLGLRICVCVTTRNRIDLETAWGHAPFTRRLGIRTVLPALLSAIHFQMRWCKRHSVTVKVFAHEDLYHALHFGKICITPEFVLGGDKI